MNQKELRKLNRQELLELLLTQSKRIDRLQVKLNQAEAQLEDKEILLKEAGNIADAAVKLSGVFEAAQKASDYYIDQCRALKEKAQTDYKAIINDAKYKADMIVKGKLDYADCELYFPDIRPPEVCVTSDNAGEADMRLFEEVPLKTGKSTLPPIKHKSAFSVAFSSVQRFFASIYCVVADKFSRLFSNRR